MKNLSGTVMNKIIKLSACICLSFSLLACQIGLGKAVDVTAPTLNVETPERNSSVPQTVTVSGTAQDNIGVALIEVTVEKDGATPHNYRYTAGSWQHLVNNEWQDFSAGSVSGKETDLTWEVRIPVTDASTGDSYTITTNVYDKMNNEGSNSKDERKVLIDVKEPLVSINKPTVTTDYTEALKNFQMYELCNNNYLQNLINQDITISGYQKEDSQLDYLYVFLDQETDDSLPALDSEITDYLFKKECTGSQLKNWTVTITQDELADYQTGKYLFRLITESHDKAGNVERKVQGWFTYWNDADAPWVYADFGKTKDDFDALIAANNIEEANIYPGCSLQGQAYDDDGLKSVTITIYKLSEGNWEQVSTSTKNLDTENNPEYYAWSTFALAETCQFYVEASCVDINGVKSVSTVKKYMNVSDVNPPKITVTTNTQASLFGDASGDFKIQGNVIDDDVNNIPELVVVWIKDVTNQKYYVNTAYEGWSRDISAATGDKRFVVTLPTRDENKTQYYGEFSQNLNIFTDLNIGIGADKNALNTQVFALKATDSGGQTSTTFISFAGDYEKPELEITDIVVDGGAKQSFKTASGTLLLAPFNRDASGNIASKVKLYGTWKDDSTDIWTDKTKIGKIDLTWTGIDDSINVTMNADGTWQSDELTPPDSSTASITATLQDIGNNTATANECFNININRPELVRLSAKTQNGNYNAGDTINLTMEFNKTVKFSGTTPKLKLNLGDSDNPKYAEYVSGNESAVHVFTYTVAAGDNTSDLDVTEITADSTTKWIDMSDENTEVANITIPVVEANKLSGNRDIVIDTTAPKLSKFEATSATGDYNLGKQLYFTATFSEEVNIEGISNSTVKLLLNNNDYSSEVTKTGPSSLLFKYEVTDAENHHYDIDGLLANYIVFDGVTVKDNAGNELAITDGKLAVSDTSKTYNIDTIAPGKPTINLPSGVSSNVPVYDSSVTFTISFESVPQKKYQNKYKVDNGSYNDYTDAVTISTNGTHTIYAYQIDEAGNQGEVAVSDSFILDSGNVLTNVTADKPNGTYTVREDVGDVINIELVFRKAVTIESGKITVNVVNGSNKNKVINCSDGATLSTSHKFAYTVADGDSCSALNLVADSNNSNAILKGIVKDGAGKEIAAKYYTNPTGHTLLDNRSGIKVITSQPTVEGVTLSGTTLTITYSAEIVKGSNKSIVLTHGTGYKAPAVLSTDTYQTLAANNSNLSTYYELGTNGSDADGNSDLTEKYVLKYDYDTDNSALIDELKKAKANLVTVPVNSSYVTVGDVQLEDGSKLSKLLIVTLEDSYELPVKGSEYSVTIPAGLVKDKLSHESVKNTAYSVTASGVEAPVIRVQKADETIDLTKSVGAEGSVTQPLTAGVKIDCQTPGIEQGSGLTWEVKRQTNSTHAYNVSSSNTGAYTLQCPNNKYANPTTRITTHDWDTNDTTEYSSLPLTLGSESNNEYGYIYCIKATASKTGTTDQVSYEYAYRSVFSLVNTPIGDVGGDANYTQLWLRGGDDTSGGLSTAGFPFSWKNKEFSKVRAMTFAGSKRWYYVSWKINTTAYADPLRGDMPADAAENGPCKWCWAMQGPVPTGFQNYALYPGQSVSVDGSVNYGYSGMSFAKKHCEYRDSSGNVTTGYISGGTPAEAKEVLSSSVTINDSGENKELSVDSTFDYKEDTILYITVSSSQTWSNWKSSGEWADNTIYSTSLDSPVAFIIMNNKLAAQFKTGKVWLQTVGCTITSIKAYNEE